MDMQTAVRGGATFKFLAKSLQQVVDTKADSFLNSLIASSKTLVVGFNELTTEFEKQFAQGKQVKQQTKELYTELNILGVSIEDIVASRQALTETFTDFTMLTIEQQGALQKTANLLRRGFGIAFADFSAGIQTTTKAMGMSEKQAAAFQSELTETAKELGLSIPGLTAKFASMGPELAKFGGQGGKAFKEVARIFKLTGLEMEKVIALTAKFDTFEGAAESAGMLNAALGGNFVNAMDLLMDTDPSARFMQIRNAIDQTGLSFDEMGYYQRIFFAEAAGLDNVNDLALLMSGNMDLLSGATNQSAQSIVEQAKRAEEQMTIMEDLKALMFEVAEVFIRFEDEIKSATSFLKEYGMEIVGVIAAVKLYSIVVGFAMGIQKLSNALGLTTRASAAANVKTITVETAAIHRQNQALIANTKFKKMSAAAGITGAGAMFGGAVKIAAVGLALVGLGVGLKFAFEGMSQFANSVKDFSSDKLLAFAAAIAALTVPMTVMVGLIKPFAAGLPLLAKGLAAIGMVSKAAMAGVAVLAALGAVGTVLLVLFRGLDDLRSADALSQNVQKAAAVAEFASGVSGATVAQYEAADKAFAGIAQSISDTSGIKLASFAILAKAGAIGAVSPNGVAVGAMSGAQLGNVVNNNAQTTNNTVNNAGGRSDNVHVDVNVTLDHPAFRNAVFEAVDSRTQEAYPTCDI